MPRLPQPFARSVLVTALTLLFVSGLVEHAMRAAGLPVAAGAALAKDGGGSSGGSGGGGSGSSGGSGSTGSSGGGSGSSGSSGSGSSGSGSGSSGSSGSSSGSGSGGGSHDSSSGSGGHDSSSHDDSGPSDDSGRGQGLGGGTGGGSRSDDGGASRAEVSHFLETLKTRGQVVASSRRDGIEVRYSDGWTERVRDGRYALIDPRRRVVIERPGRRSDVRRLDAAIDSSRRN